MALDSESMGMVVTNSVFIGLALIIVALRVFVRIKQAGLEIDDYLIVVAWLIAAGLAASNIVGVPVGGFGVPYQDLSDDMAQQFLKILFVQQFWYIFSVAFIKFSVLCFYGRVFVQYGRYPMVIKIFMGVVLAWLISFFVATLIQVVPIWCNWEDCGPPLTDYSLMYALCSATDIALDICILSLPAFFIQKLHLDKFQKIGLTGIFGVGIFCVVASVVRLAYTVIFIKQDPTADFAADFGPAIVATIMWSGIEASASIICASLPACWPLIRNTKLLTWLKTSFKTGFSTGSRSGRTPSGKDSQNQSSSGNGGSVPPNGYFDARRQYPKRHASGRDGLDDDSSSTEYIVRTEIEGAKSLGNDMELEEGHYLAEKTKAANTSWLKSTPSNENTLRNVEMGAIRVDTRMVSERN